MHITTAPVFMRFIFQLPNLAAFAVKQFSRQTWCCSNSTEKSSLIVPKTKIATSNCAKCQAVIQRKTSQSSLEFDEQGGFIAICVWVISAGILQRNATISRTEITDNCFRFENNCLHKRIVPTSCKQMILRISVVGY